MNTINTKQRMRYVYLSTALAGAALLSACSPQVMDFRNAEIVNAKVYKEGADKPFTGKLTNIPDVKFLASQAGMRTILNQVKEVYLRGNSSYVDTIGFSASLCDVQISEGVVDGAVVCKQAGSAVIRYEMSFKRGTMDGAFKLFDLSAENHEAITASFKDGVLDGRQELFSLKTHKVISRLIWEKGILSGTTEVFDENTGNLISSTFYKNGKAEGDIVSYAPDGKRVIYRVKAVEGLKQGLEEQFDAVTGKPLLSAVWANGKKDGPYKQWDADGKVLVDTVYKDDVEVSLAAAKPAVSGPAVDACADRWAAAYRKEQGADVMVTQDQLSEWTSWCQQGRLPK
ncbi:toxin-antitoxin system YwqK family antitoxin [Rhodoferax sp.]|uniref:toxin-antitoxin system YwqK family antitoxin n=1 Tax=Rhodoferax sp. TaxID=50421 RepID=UPI00374DA70F